MRLKEYPHFLTFASGSGIVRYRIIVISLKRYGARQTWMKNLERFKTGFYL